MFDRLRNMVWMAIDCLVAGWCVVNAIQVVNSNTFISVLNFGLAFALLTFANKRINDCDNER